MTSQQVTLINASGLHARPASDFVKMAKSFTSKITVRNIDGGTAVNAKSIVMVLSQGLCKDMVVEIAADGEDEAAAVSALADLVRSGFGED